MTTFVTQNDLLLNNLLEFYKSNENIDYPIKILYKNFHNGFSN